MNYMDSRKNKESAFEDFLSLFTNDPKKNEMILHKWLS